MMLVGVAGLAGSGKDTVADILVSKYGFCRVSFADPLKRYAMEVYDFTEEQLWGPSENRNAPDKRYMRGWKLPECGCVCSKWHWYNEKQRAFMVDEILDLCDQHNLTWWKSRVLFPHDDDGAAPEPEYLTPRLALQLLGTEWGRKCYDNTWVDYAIRVARKITEEGLGYSPVTGLNRLGWLDGQEPTGVVIPDLRFLNEFEGIKAADGIAIRVVRPGSGLKGVQAKHASETQAKLIPDHKFGAVFQNTKTLDDLAQMVDKFMVERAWNA
jgi:hypothetical protein